MDVLEQLERLAALRQKFSPEDVELAAGTPIDLQLAAMEHEVNPVNEREIARIVGMPIQPALKAGTSEFEQFCYERIDATHYDLGFRLFEPQVNGWAAYRQFGGLFGAIGVGWGKTLLTAAIANTAYTERKIDRIVLIVPSNVYTQLSAVDLAWIRARISLSVPFHLMGHRTAEKRRAMFLSGYRGCYILTYSLLSTTDATEMLQAIRPGLVILDEAHNVKHRRAARTRRLFHYLDDTAPEAELVALSGTITAKGIEDYHHILRRALGNNCPLPLGVRLASEWGFVLNSGALPSEAQAVEFMPLVHWARGTHPEGYYTADVSGFRNAYALRFSTAPGVVSTGDSEIGCSLVLSNQPVPEHEECAGWEELKILMDRVETMWLTPGDDEIEYAVHAFKWLYELSAGFYNELYWPTPTQLAKQRGCSEDQAAQSIDEAKEHHKAQQLYAQGLRAWLKAHHVANCDTPMLVARNMSLHGPKTVGKDLYDLWRVAKDLETPGMAERWSRAIRICPYKIDEAVSWAKDLPRGKGGIIWVHHIEMGEWCYDALIDAGVDALHCPAGEQHNRAIIDPAHAHRVVVAGLDAHGEGKNLQHFEHMFYLQWPRRAVKAEQSLGRVHRNGQRADEVEARLCNTLEFDYLVFAACLQDALYIHQTTRVRQKVIYGNHNPLPRIYSSEWLRERGMENERLNKEQRQALQDRFGSYIK